MSIVVEQTLPFTSSQLRLDDSDRWSQLFPLIRPSTKTITIGDGRSIVIDTALAKSTSKDVLVAAIVAAGNFSDKILRESHIAAFATEAGKNGAISGEDITRVLQENGFPTGNGVVVIRVDSKHGLSTKSDPGALEAFVGGELELDHILSLLGAVNQETKSSFEKAQRLINHFIKAATKTTSKFHEEKTGKGPNIIHASETAEFCSAKKSVEIDLRNLLGSRPPSAEEVVYAIHVSDLNGMSRLENNILVHEISEFFAQKNLPAHISHSTILDNHSQARGWALSLCPVPVAFLAPQPSPSNPLTSSIGVAAPTKPREGVSKIQISDAQVRKVITEGCESVIKAEPEITEYDTIVGDGDCGYTLRDGAKQVLSFISHADLSTLPSTLSELVDDLEVNMGGTSGALYCIFLSSLAQSLWEAPTFPDALQGALDHLLKYTRARLGDRTCLDCLIPFVETLKNTKDLKWALKDAANGVETTKKLEAKLGRSSYLDEAATRGIPDPGAYGLLKLLEGMVAAE